MNLYLWINLLCLAGPLFLSFDKKVHFYKYWKTLFPAILIVGSVFVAWDIYFIDVGVWGFHSDYPSKTLFFNLPFEKVIFFCTIPYAFVFIHETIKAYFPKLRPVRFSYYFSFLFTIIAVVLAIVYREHHYTFIALLSAGLINWIVYFGFTPRWYPFFILVFLITQIPLLIINGILAGALAEVPIIWYNETEIIGLHFFSVPVENIFYNFLLLFPIVIIHEYLFTLWEQKTKST